MGQPHCGVVALGREGEVGGAEATLRHGEGPTVLKAPPLWPVPGSCCRPFRAPRGVGNEAAIGAKHPAKRTAQRLLLREKVAEQETHQGAVVGARRMHELEEVGTHEARLSRETRTGALCASLEQHVRVLVDEGDLLASVVVAGEPASGAAGQVDVAAAAPQNARLRCAPASEVPSPVPRSRADRSKQSLWRLHPVVLRRRCLSGGLRRIDSACGVADARMATPEADSVQHKLKHSKPAR